MHTIDQTMRRTAEDLRSLPVYQLTEEELAERMRPAYEQIKKEKFAKGGYLTYYDPEFCPDDSYTVHEYSDRKELFKLGVNGQAQFIKTL